MKQFLAKVKLLLKQVRSYLPSQLPVGLTAFNAYADDIIELSGNFADKDSMVFAIASILIHIDAGTASVSKQYFVKRLRKSAANQVASQVFQDIKTKQQAALEAAKTAQSATQTV
jgi:hypothetical protein